jgi:DNA-binding CsgD family transcriptional regulator
VLRLVVWARESATEAEPAFLVAAAVHANSLTDRQLAEELARAALEHEPSDTASLALGEALVSQSRCREAVVVLTGVRGHDDSTRARIAHWLAMAMHGHKDPDGAIAALVEAESTVTEPRWVDFLRADRAAVLAQSGRFALAAELAEHLVDDAETDEIVKLRAITPVGWRWTASGQARRAEAAAKALVGAAARHPAELPRAPAWVFHTRATALLFLGELDELEGILAKLTGTANPEAAVHVTLYRGRLALVRGKVAQAAADLRDALAGLANPSGERAWALGLLAEAHAQLGDVVTSERFRREATEAHNFWTFYAPDVARATAWTSAAAGELSRARSDLLATAEQCRVNGEPGMEAHVLHDALRFGARYEVTKQLGTLVDAVDGAWVRAFADHATALAADDGATLDGVGGVFEHIGAFRHAAEARAEAAAAHQRAGLTARAALSMEAAERLLAECEGSVVPALPVVDLAGQTLSRREEEIARLAARGLSNREIADRLFVSVRTVEGHLHRLYAKLGVNDRSELAPVVRAPTENA